MKRLLQEPGIAMTPAQVMWRLAVGFLWRWRWIVAASWLVSVIFAMIELLPMSRTEPEVILGFVYGPLGACLLCFEIATGTEALWRSLPISRLGYAITVCAFCVLVLPLLGAVAVFPFMVLALFREPFPYLIVSASIDAVLRSMFIAGVALTLLAGFVGVSDRRKISGQILFASSSVLFLITLFAATGLGGVIVFPDTVIGLQGGAVAVIIVLAISIWPTTRLVRRHASLEAPRARDRIEKLRIPSAFPSRRRGLYGRWLLHVALALSAMATCQAITLVAVYSDLAIKVSTIIILFFLPTFVVPYFCLVRFLVIAPGIRAWRTLPISRGRLTTALFSFPFTLVVAALTLTIGSGLIGIRWDFLAETLKLHLLFLAISFLTVSFIARPWMLIVIPNLLFSLVPHVFIRLLWDEPFAWRMPFALAVSIFAGTLVFSLASLHYMILSGDNMYHRWAALPLRFGGRK